MPVSQYVKWDYNSIYLMGLCEDQHSPGHIVNTQPLFTAIMIMMITIVIGIGYRSMIKDLYFPARKTAKGDT